MTATSYISDAPFAGVYQAAQSPVRLAFLAALNGHAPPAVDAAYTFCDLACGTGTTLNTLAAANPRARFVGVDFNAGHIEQARRLAAAAALDNVDFVHADLDGFDPDALPELDFLTVHGAYSWLGPAAARTVVEVARRRLRPGGLCAVQVLSTPHAADDQPGLRLLRALAAEGDGDSAARAARGLDLVVALCEAKAPFFADHPAAERMVRRLDQERRLMPERINRIAHIALAETPRPMLAGDLAAELAPAGLSLVAPVDERRNDLALCVPRALRPLFERMAGRAQVESALDFVVGDALPSFLFVKDAAPDETAAAAFLDNLHVVRLVGAGALRRTVAGGGETARLSSPRYDDVARALGAAGPVAALATAPGLEGLDPGERHRLLAGLVAAGNYQVAAAAPGAAPETPPARVAAAVPFNRAILDEAAAAFMPAALAGRAAGAGSLVLDRLDVGLLAAMLAGADDPAAYAASVLADSDGAFPRGALVVRARDVARADLDKALARLRAGVLPVLIRMGAVAAA